jgi:HAD superfamily hydrolase (TIGR01509 family)
MTSFNVNNIELVIFDCDGTLVDSEYVNNKSISDMLTSLGHPKFTLKYCIDYFAGCSVHDVIHTLNMLKISDPDKALKNMHQHAMRIAREELMAINGVLDTISQIKLPKCVASNGERHIVCEYIDITKLNKFFTRDQIFTRELVVKPKPEPDLYLYAANAMGNFLPERCLVIEDSVVGVTAGKAAGMHVVGFTGANHHHERSESLLMDAGAFVAVRKFQDILKYIPS